MADRTLFSFWTRVRCPGAIVCLRIIASLLAPMTGAAQQPRALPQPEPKRDLSEFYQIRKVGNTLFVFPPSDLGATIAEPHTAFILKGVISPTGNPETCSATTTRGVFSVSPVRVKDLPDPSSQVNTIKFKPGLALQIEIATDLLTRPVPAATPPPAEPAVRRADEPTEQSIDLLRREYLDLVTKLSLISDRCFDPYGLEITLARLVEAVPTSFETSLLLAYGLDTANKRAQLFLQPGMRLRVENATFQTSRIKDGVGYVSVGSQFLTVSRRPAADKNKLGYLAFDSFLGRLGYLDAPPQRISSLKCSDGRMPPNWMTNAVDLHLRGHERLYYGLLYPVEAPDPRRESQDDPCDLVSLPVLIGANTLPGLLKAMDSTRPPLPTSCDVMDGDCPTYSVFIGRSTVTAEIQVTFNEQRVFVPVGTTVRDLLTADSNLSYLEVASPSDGKTGLQVWRRFNVDYRPFLWKDADADILDLPLLKGDRVCLPCNTRVSDKDAAR